MADLTSLPTPSSSSSSSFSSELNGLQAEQEPQATTEGAAAAAAACTCQPQLPNLRSLYLKNCLVAGQALQALLGAPVVPSKARAASSAGVMFGATGPLCAGGRCGGCRGSQLTRLSVSGDNATHGEVAEGWSTWVAVVKQLTRLQVLDLTVPDSLGCSLPPELLDALCCLPRLAHMHLTTSHQPLQLLGLTQLTGIRTLSINYTGPPALPSQMLWQLHAGLGPNCKVHLWEMVVMQQQNSFGAANVGGLGAIGGAEGNNGRTRRGAGVVRQLAAVLGWGAVVAGGWCCGWLLGGSLNNMR